MNLQRIVPMMLCVMLGLSLNACYFKSVNPLPPSAELDKSLLGWWRAAPDEDKNPQHQGYFLFLEDKNGLFQVVLLDQQYQFDEQYLGFCSEINGEKYMNLRQVSIGDGKRAPVVDPHYYLVHYSIKDKKQLEMSLLNENYLKQALKNKQLKGTQTKGDDLLITDTSERLSAFLAAQPMAELLDKKLTPAEEVNAVPEMQP
jgi:hypothetical protein